MQLRAEAEQPTETISFPPPFSSSCLFPVSPLLPPLSSPCLLPRFPSPCLLPRFVLAFSFPLSFSLSLSFSLVGDDWYLVRTYFHIRVDHCRRAAAERSRVCDVQSLSCLYFPGQRTAVR